MIGWLTLLVPVWGLMITLLPNWNATDFFASLLGSAAGQGRGACCFPSGQCFEVTEQACLLTGGRFKGDDSTCVTQQCSGACCVEGELCLERNSAACGTVDGRYQGDGTDCSQFAIDCPPTTGACCRNQDFCFMASPDECRAQDDHFFGLGIPCDQVTCHPPEHLGACCRVDGSYWCAVTRAFCNEQGAAHLGPGSDCGPQACTGACCFSTGLGRCENQHVPLWCRDNGGSFQGFATVCSDPTIDCPGSYGACCFGNGNCDRGTAQRCEDAGGTYQGDDTFCYSGNVFCNGACCLPLGECTQTPPAYCDGTFQGFATTCSDSEVACPGPYGACCLEDGNCRLGNSSGCQAAGGVYQGDGSSCGQVICYGACCDGFGGCYHESLRRCLDVGHVFNGIGVTCTGALCLGACCDDLGGCMETGHHFCAGFFEGYGTSCQDVELSCPEPRGACCFPDGGCRVGNPERCAESGGEYQGDGTTCDYLTCRGACCDELGDCYVASRRTCGGTFQGLGTSCEDQGLACSPPRGACCFENGHCRIGNASSCGDAGGQYRGDSSVCYSKDGIGQCYGACCNALGGCEIRSPRDCEGQFQGQGSTCNDSEIACPGPMGACCLPHGECQLGRGERCAEVGGVFQGDRTDCFSIDGSYRCRGACCDDIGGCHEFTVPSSCFGAFQGFGSECGDQDIACPGPYGACCFPNGDCGISGADRCTTSGGTYQGDDSICDFLACRGACCSGEGSCYYDSEGSCVAGGGTFLGNQVLCEDVVCCGACCDDLGGCRPTGPRGCFEPDHYQGLGTSCSETEGNCGTPRGACCFHDGSCRQAQAAHCEAAGGAYGGDHTNCPTSDLVGGPGLCGGGFESGPFVSCRGACCLFTESCVDEVTRDRCEGYFGGDYQGHESDCFEAEDCAQPSVACCIPPGNPGADGNGGDFEGGQVGLSFGECRQLTAFECSLAGGEVGGADCAATECPNEVCPGRGDCCAPHHWAGCDDASCCATVCEIDPQCCFGFPTFWWDEICTMLAESFCVDERGPLCKCSSETRDCPTGDVAFVDPPNGVVDARQPHALGPSGVHQSQGIAEVWLAGPEGAAACCFSLCEPPAFGSGNSISSTEPVDPGLYRIHLDHRMTSGTTMKIYYSGAFTPGEFISHPGNVNGDGEANTQDVFSLVDCLNGVDPGKTCPWGLYSCDADHSRHCNPQDVLRVLDLLNGAGEFEPSLGTLLPELSWCP